jgi:hypothetical protein
MRATRTLLLMLVLASPLVGACAGGDPIAAPVAPDDPVGAFVAPATLLAAVGDLRERVLPALDAELRPPMGGALAELAAALGAGQPVRARRALTAVRALVAGHVHAAAGVATADPQDGTTAIAAGDPDGADLAGIELVLAAADVVVAGAPASGAPAP